jgi:SAM-dependent methyltransferase
MKHPQVSNDYFDSFACPSCSRASLVQAAAEQSPPRIECPACGSYFPVINGIPRLVDMENYSSSFGFQWNQHRLTQLDSYSGLSISRDRLLAATGWKTLSDAKGMKILEAGSGAGRFTEVLVSTGAQLYSFDYSTAVEANATTNGGAPNLTLFQGDIYHMPIADATFDWVLCLGVIQHTPDPAASFRSLARKVRPGGWLAIDVYTFSFGHALQWKYLLRPITRRIDQQHLYSILARVVPMLLPTTQLLKRLFGRVGARLSPIVEYSQHGLPPALNAEWSLLDSFDMYAPAHDHPQSLRTVKRWFAEEGFVDVEVFYGANGIVGRGRRPHFGFEEDK